MSVKNPSLPVECQTAAVEKKDLQFNHFTIRSIFAELT